MPASRRAKCWAEDDDLETKWWAVFCSRSSSAFPPAAAGVSKGMVVSIRDAHPAAHPFHLTLRGDVLSRRDLGAARNASSSSQVQCGYISES